MPPKTRTKGTIGVKKQTKGLTQQSLRRSLSQQAAVDLDSELESVQERADEISNLAAKISKLKNRMIQSFESLQQDFAQTIEDLQQSVEELKAENVELKRKCTSLENRMKTLEHNRDSHAELINKNERFSRRNNIRIVGYVSQDGENCLDLAQSVLEEIGLPSCKLERAHRDGRFVPGRERHILVKLSYYQDKVTALKSARRALANKNYYIIDDLTKTDLAEKRKWKGKVQELFQSGTRLHFAGGRWRGNDGKPFNFDSA